MINHDRLVLGANQVRIVQCVMGKDSENNPLWNMKTCMMVTISEVQLIESHDYVEVEIMSVGPTHLD